MNNKVLHVCSNRNPIYVNLWDELIENRIDLSVFHFSNKRVGMPEPGSIYDKEYIDTSLPFSNIDRWFFFNKEKKVMRALKNRLSGKSFNMIHAHTLFSEGYLAYKLHKESGIPYIVAVRNTDINVFFKYRKYLHGLGCEILKNADRIVFLTSVYEQKLFDKYIPKKFRDELKSKIVIIPNGIDSLFLNNMAQPRSRVSENKLNVITVGMVNKNKNQTYICDQLEKYQNDNPDIIVSYKNFGIIRFERDKKYAALLNKYPFAERCEPKSHMELIEEYRKADIFALLSKTESFGIVYAEAISQGLPILYTKGEGFDTQFDDGVVGHAVDLSKNGDFVQKLESILKDYEGFSKRALEGASKFDWKKIGRRYSELYAEVIQANGGIYEI
ncbi:MAG: glycosyltransferase family 4 protein [[Eubacterium] sulci]|nr:glycosyltransferase family 4 protein [[Eubacterium] sulci]